MNLSEVLELIGNLVGIVGGCITIFVTLNALDRDNNSDHPPNADGESSDSGTGTEDQGSKKADT